MIKSLNASSIHALGLMGTRAECQKVSNSRLLQGFFIFLTSAVIFYFIPVLYWQSQSVKLLLQSDPKIPSLNILIGIITTSAAFERRSLLRLAYSLQPPPTSANVSIRFVLGKPKSRQEGDLVSLEILRFNDIIQLDCEENMNQGKTFTYFSTVPSRGIRYDYVMKADDDAYIRLENLAHSLLQHPREDLYYGLPIGPNGPTGFMTGEGYVLSWDLVEWIAESPIPRNMSMGKEDLLPKLWFNAGKKAKHRANLKPLFYDHPAYGGYFAHQFIPETILIHQLKGLDRWMDVLSYFEFNGTRSSSIAKVKGLLNYLLRHGIPYHPLHDQGYPSIGDVQSTLPVRKEKWFEYGGERSGRFQGLTNKDGSSKIECGIHVGKQ